MRALTLESSMITGIPLAGTDFVLTPEAIADRVASRLSAEPTEGPSDVPHRLSQLRPARGAGVRLRRRDHEPRGSGRRRPGAGRLPVLPSERQRVADRVVAASRRMSPVVHGRTTHLDERDPPDVLADGAARGLPRDRAARGGTRGRDPIATGPSRSSSRDGSSPRSRAIPSGPRSPRPASRSRRAPSNTTVREACCA